MLQIPTDPKDNYNEVIIHLKLNDDELKFVETIGVLVEF